MNVNIFVKGKDDFGREKINGNVFQYSQHYPRPKHGDLQIYIFPKDNAVGIYEVREELEHYLDGEGFQYCRGTMVRWGGQPVEYVEALKKQNKEAGEKLENLLVEALKKNNMI